MFKNPLSNALYYKGMKDYYFDKDDKSFDELIDALRDKRAINYYYAQGYYVAFLSDLKRCIKTYEERESTCKSIRLRYEEQLSKLEGEFSK